MLDNWITYRKTHSRGADFICPWEHFFQLSDLLRHIPLYTAYFFSDTLRANLFFRKRYRRKYTCHRSNSVCYLRGDKKFLNFSETSSRLPNLCYNEKGSCRIRLSVGHQLPKLNRRVRLPYPACRKPRNIQHAWNIPGFLLSRYFYCHIIIYLCCPPM